MWNFYGAILCFTTSMVFLFVHKIDYAILFLVWSVLARLDYCFERLEENLKNIQRSPDVKL